MTEKEWLKGDNAADMLGCFLVVDARKLRLFAVACCRCSGQLLQNSDLRDAVNLAEQFADGLTSADALAAAHRLAGIITRELDTGHSKRERRRWTEAAAVLNATAAADKLLQSAKDAVWQIDIASHRRDAHLRMAALLRDIFGNPFRQINVNRAWITSDVLALARGIYDEREFDRMPILADALQDAGCDSTNILDHCRDPELVHARGCWVIDLLLGLR